MRQPCGEKESFWHFVLSEHAESGLSVSEFCRLEGVSQASFYQWRKKLASPAATVTTESTSDAPTSLAKASGVEPFAWLKDVFGRLPHHRGGEAFAQVEAGESVTSKELDYLLPDVWLKANPDHKWTIDEIRRKEREAKDV